MVEYALRIPENFDFGKGGKLPGLGGGNFPSGGNIPDGLTGWSTRFMWRRSGDGEVYLYAPYQDNPPDYLDERNPVNNIQRQQNSEVAFGISVGRGSWRFQPDGKWHTIAQEIGLNTPGIHNGRLKVLYDDKEVMNRNDLVFRTAPSLQIDGLMFSVGHGGSDSTWSPNNNTYIDFSNFTVTASK